MQEKDLTWEEAIEQVLSQASEPMHYRDIASTITENGIKTVTGLTPEKSVATTLSRDMMRDRQVQRTRPGIYQLTSQSSSRRGGQNPPPSTNTYSDDTPDTFSLTDVDNAGCDAR